MIPRNLVPDQHYNNTFIAGGYAACPAMATDIDVWVFVDGGTQPLDEAREDVLKHLQANFDITEDVGGTVGDYNGVGINILKVAFVRGYTLPIHIMVCDAPCGIVLKNFDISTHQVALTPHGVVIGEHWTPITVPPVVLERMENEHTQSRLQKITERYAKAA